MLRLAGLRAGGGRSGVDAYHDFEDNGRSYSAPMELKSTTSRAVSTARVHLLAGQPSRHVSGEIGGFADGKSSAAVTSPTR